MKNAIWLRNRKRLLIKTIQELIDDGFYSDYSLAKELGTYGKKIKAIRTTEVNLNEDTINKYLNLLGIK